MGDRRSFRTSSFGKPNRPPIDSWEIGDFFGAPVVRGIVGGYRVTVRLLWWANNRFGVARSGKGTEEVLKVGTPASSKGRTAGFELANRGSNPRAGTNGGERE